MTDQMISEDELHAYVDGELPADRRNAVEAWLAAHADDAARVAAWRTRLSSSASAMAVSPAKCCRNGSRLGS